MGVVLVDVVVVVISLNVEPAIETIGVSGIIAAANDETATAGRWLLALTAAVMALTVASMWDVDEDNDVYVAAD